MKILFKKSEHHIWLHLTILHFFFVSTSYFINVEAKQNSRVILLHDAIILGDFSGPCTIPNPIRVQSWLNKTRSCFLLLLSLFTYCIVHNLKHVHNWTLWTSKCSFVSLRMIYETLIWCNQILIVKHQWSAMYVTSRMIFLMKYSWYFKSS